MSTESFSFNQQEAIDHGLHEAIILQQVRNFVRWAKLHNQHCFEGRHWTHNTRKAWAKHFGFMTEKQARDAIENLVKKGIFIKGDFAENRFRRPTYVTLNDESSLALQGHSTGPTGPHVDTSEGHSTLALQGHSSIYNYSSTKDHNIYTEKNCDDQFEQIYKEYPRKEGKSRGYKLYKAQIKTPDDARDLIRAIKNFKAEHRSLGTEKRFIKHFGTFMGEWRDWVNYEQAVDETLTQEQLDERYGVKK